MKVGWVDVIRSCRWVSQYGCLYSLALGGGLTGLGS